MHKNNGNTFRWLEALINWLCIIKQVWFTYNDEQSSKTSRAVL